MEKADNEEGEDKIQKHPQKELQFFGYHTTNYICHYAQCCQTLKKTKKFKKNLKKS